MTNAPANPRFFALIPCGGSGTRAGTPQPKQYAMLAGQPLVMHTLAAFAQVQRIASTLVVIAPTDRWWDTQVGTKNTAACAGSTRAATVFNGLEHLLAQGAQPSDWVLVHDAARCLVTPAMIDSLIDACQHDAVGGLLAIKLSDTLKTEHQGRVSATVSRTDKWLAQTPQMFRIKDLLAGQHLANARALDATDEASLIEMTGQSPKLVAGSAQNFKVTYPPDFALAEAILKARQ